MWPEGTPQTVTFTMEGLNLSLPLLHVRDCRVIGVQEMGPGGLYSVSGVEPGDVFIEVREPVTVKIGDPVDGPFCRGG